MELGIGADADVGFAWSGGGEGEGAGGVQVGMEFRTVIVRSCSTDSGGALPRSLSAAAAADRKDQRNLEIGRASCRERGEISVVAVSLKKIRQTDLHHGGAADAGRRRHFFLAELLFADFAG